MWDTNYSDQEVQAETDGYMREGHEKIGKVDKRLWGKKHQDYFNVHDPKLGVGGGQEEQERPDISLWAKQKH